MTDKELEELLSKKLDEKLAPIIQRIDAVGQGIVHIATTLKHAGIDENARICMAKMVEAFAQVQPDVAFDDEVAERIAADSYRIARAMDGQSKMDHLRAAVAAVNVGGEKAKA